jgi:hypothetical protein
MAHTWTKYKCLVMFISDSVAGPFNGIEVVFFFERYGHNLPDDSIPDNIDLQEWTLNASLTYHDNDNGPFFDASITCLSTTGACTSPPPVLTCIGFESPLRDGPE